MLVESLINPTESTKLLSSLYQMQVNITWRNFFFLTSRELDTYTLSKTRWLAIFCGNCIFAFYTNKHWTLEIVHALSFSYLFFFNFLLLKSAPYLNRFCLKFFMYHGMTTQFNFLLRKPFVSILFKLTPCIGPFAALVGRRRRPYEICPPHS